MMADYLQVQGERRGRSGVLRITGELDAIMARALAQRADAAMRILPWPVLVDLSGLTFLDAHGARALALVIRKLAPGRLAGVRSCPPHVRRTLDLLGLPRNYLSAPLLLSDVHIIAPEFQARDLAERLRRAQNHARDAKLDASGIMARLSDTCGRLASTRERSVLLREQCQQTLAGSRSRRLAGVLQDDA
jgi:anti-anti-sigma regulatory factor